MKKSLKATIFAIVSLFFLNIAFTPTTNAVLVPVTPYYQPPTIIADSVETTFFGDVEDKGDGCSVFIVLNLVLDILSGAVGIVAVVGISIVGVQYLTARGNEQQATKAKSRFFEVVIGVVAYVLLYSALNFFLPGGKFNNNKCVQSTTTSFEINRTI